MARRKGSPNEHVWRYIPEDIWRERDRLIALGVAKLNRKSRQWQQSLGTADREEAAARERRLRDQWAQEEAAWRRLLAEGPAKLSQQDALEIAAIGAVAFYEKHRAEPLDAPPPPDLARLPITLSDETRAAIAAMSDEEYRAMQEEMEAVGERLIHGSHTDRMREYQAMREGKG